MASRKRQIFSGRCLTSTEEVEALDFPPAAQAPIARLDSLQEMVCNFTAGSFHWLFASMWFAYWINYSVVILRITTSVTEIV